MNKVYIAGAHSRGQTIGHYLRYLDPKLEIMAYLYDNDEDNPDQIEGVPVIRIDEKTILEKECPVYLATRGANYIHLTKSLKKCGVKRIIPVDVKLDTEIRNRYLEIFFNSEGKEYIKINKLNYLEYLSSPRKKSALIYVANSIFDGKLEKKYKFENYEKRLQVGSALTEKRLEDSECDCIGDNISEKNTQYCELTGLYWIWKHAKEDYIGLCHYRRHFILPDHWIELMEQYAIDVILPVPLYVAPNIEENFRGRHAAKEWDYMMTYLQKNLPEDYAKAKVFFQGNLYSPCNMLIVKREILNAVCTWLFPILDAVVKECGMEENRYENRYPGFLSERLITYFFETKRERYKIVYADKNFLT